ncbi:hypothetical protein DCAR_0206671 [Daucus carota subsp. sativus]|uniref:Uncharacterized protein n=1 Tax=Daucus carota subsp. sativus TaxID=79200 RepID=A0A161X279_DAUCS|nr:hypothetical protein DCAR_0206671 [Daucus carota subsp. sativus]
MKLYMKMLFLMLVALCTTTIPTGHARPLEKYTLYGVSSMPEASLRRLSVSSGPKGPKTSPVHVSVASEPKGPMGPKASSVHVASEPKGPMGPKASPVHVSVSSESIKRPSSAAPDTSPEHVASEPMANPLGDAPDTSPEHVSSESTTRPIAPKASAKRVFSVAKGGPAHVFLGPKSGPMDVEHTAAEPDPDHLHSVHTASEPAPGHLY